MWKLFLNGLASLATPLSYVPFARLVAKDVTVSDVHIGTALGNEKPKRKPRKKPTKHEELTVEVKEAAVDWTIPFDFAKAEPDQQLIFGWASVVEQDGMLVIDKQGDIILPETLEKAAYDFCLYARDHGDMHDKIGTGRLVESMVFTKEKQQALGIDLKKIGWWVGFKVDDPEIWKVIKAGGRPEFSIGGTAVSEEILDLTVEAPAKKRSFNDFIGEV